MNTTFYCSQSIEPFSFMIIIYSLWFNWLCFHFFLFLSSAYQVVQVVCLVHSDLHNDQSLTAVNFLASSILMLTYENQQQNTGMLSGDLLRCLTIQYIQDFLICWETTGLMSPFSFRYILPCEWLMAHRMNFVSDETVSWCRLLHKRKTGKVLKKVWPVKWI